jgi:DNA polymerase I-like protein with 3'-5' exonuclease and polymerase domains
MSSFKYITTLEDYQAAVEMLSSSTAALALDVETSVRGTYKTVGSALDAHTAEISLLILKRAEGQPLIFDLAWLRALDYDRAPLRDLLLKTDRILGANLRFDLKFLYNEFGVWFKNVFDVVVASKLIGNATGSKVARQLGHGYADICRELLNVRITGKKEERVSSWALDLSGRNLENEYWLGKLTYAANDVQYLFPIREIQTKTLVTPMPHTDLNQTGNHSDDWGLGMQESLDREMRLVSVIAKMEYIGMPADRKMMGYFQEGIRQEMEEVAVYLSYEFNLDQPIDLGNGKEQPTRRALSTLRSSTELLKLINVGLKLEKFDSTQAEGLRRACELLDIFAASENRQQTAQEVFVDVEEAELYSEFLELEESALLQLTPVVKAILKFKKLTKQDGMDLRKYINVATGRIHCSYDQLGAATSRMSAATPNMQQQSGRTTCKITMPKEEFFPSEVIQPTQPGGD